MRLSQIKLAGFKSFVDPTTIATPGQLVGIVGPNGCGKSNVIDAVRWVLGESRASALRGESMQDVIFNGAGERKPVGRASVELVFDNSHGRIGGQWGQYSELSIKRVLQRDGDSSYFINNIGVRRRDIHDLFLGTGLGPRAYAIIEQGMISRIIEAKPEELRVFLEEAAGISKYKERRRETEGRLSNTRENLLRVEDIRAELDQQLSRLEAQARVASEYRDLETRLAQAQQLLWFGRQQEAARQRLRHASEIAALGAELEALHARLREQEAGIERERTEHFAAGDRLHAAQGEFYATSAEVTRLEQQLAYQRESEQRLRQQESQASVEVAALVEDMARIDAEHAVLSEGHAQAQAGRARSADAERAAAAALPQCEEAVRTAAQALAQAQQEASAVEQGLRVEEARREQLERMLQQLAGRQQRLIIEESELQAPVDEQIAHVEARAEELRARVAAHEERIEASREQVQQLEARQRTEREQARTLQQHRTEVEARVQAVAALQAKLGRSGDTAGWLQRQGLDAAPRLWQEVAIEPGWEDALEAMLRERVNAIHVPALDAVADWPEPPGRVVLFTGSSVPQVPDAGSSVPEVPAGTVATAPDALLARLDVRDGAIRATLESWLHGVRCAESLRDALHRRGELARSEVFVTPSGQVVTADSLATFAPDADLHGVLARQRELEDLEQRLGGVREAADGAAQRLARTEEDLRKRRLELDEQSRVLSADQRGAHDLELELLRMRKAAEAVMHRRQAIAGELAEIARTVAVEQAAREGAESAITASKGELERTLRHCEVLRHRRNEAEVGLARARETMRAAERAAQDAMYAERTAAERIAELGRRRAGTEMQHAQAAARLAELQGEQGKVDWSALETALQEQLATRAVRESALGAARDRLESSTAALRAAEEERQRVEQQIEPARQRIEELRLKEQAASLQEQQYLEQLTSAQADLEALPERLREWGRVAQLPAEIERLQGAIVELGAVNLAALDELKAATERRDYLDRQGGDLREAITTLEDAIRRIDRETRELLQETFDKVNEQFGRLFPILFGGGAARLLLTGEEILDAGVQVSAQPPGKRNTSIHLLSGGEKALTAISLVFALFQLNPAPFCLLDEVDAPLDDPNTDRFCRMVSEMSKITQFLYISHNKITMEMASQLVGITMPEPGVSHVVAVDIAEAIELARAA